MKHSTIFNLVVSCFCFGTVSAQTDSTRAAFNDPILSIPELSVGDLLYRIELTLTSIEPVTFVLVSAEELLSFSPELFGDNTFYNVFYDGSEDTQSWVVEHLIFDSQGTFTLREQNGVYEVLDTPWQVSDGSLELLFPGETQIVVNLAFGEAPNSWVTCWLGPGDTLSLNCGNSELQYLFATETDAVNLFNSVVGTVPE